MEKWLPYLDRFGLMAAIVAVIGYFLIKHWWPYWKEQDAQERKDKKDQLNRMLTLQEGSMKEMVDALRANSHQSETIAHQLNALTDTTEALVNTTKELAVEVRQRSPRR